ncbi:N-acetylmuramic acid 6-phosphate etherase [Aeromonas hydrophila]|uniref:N-acetylmuramic acid 6-phosphate etherase n=3 Tax=Aeromonas hydrophila TaxID=644 RepID=MURQ_AERHH|nr:MULTISPECIES: N-acetylmuramic acid 6-phosphate etherase [Aeromonas]A0KFC0.1 RecName: Full=N-acetylmuramic acid 6-phosphate etherase; Short=MurNAc-6-P etherase; AltName: Full=N-acetylmuramic acid 6-phosphate hydrolase; AltName: Full=N-acetylmuramic acid 6-phosphate lyase [Aeromonas hydrophila subsp. hydrophila ATCC 7966]GKQ63174.1 N-acetylmuramic acid 6-phosphate etherase [Aeromonas caviae]ABK36652.1 putative glucokinase regulator homolog [Aeromonas hydrophila subsp. hydrophila ATCC 7966]AHX3
MTIDLSSMITETRNPASVEIDQLPTLEMLRVINQEDQQVALAVSQLLPEITRAVDAIAAAFGKGGRLVYIGAGTSGRLGILDASECPPTYGVSAEQVVGLIAGGHKAILQAVENAEDDAELGAQDLKNIQFCANDVLVGIAASGRTPYVLGAMAHARAVGATVCSISCNPGSPLAQAADISMVAVVGPEIVTGSSRMKAGTAQKLILNMLSTGAMIRTGKVYGNLMVDVEATNAKLVERQKRIVMEATDCERAVAERALAQADNHCKTAIVMILAGLTADEARTRLQSSNGFISQCTH